MRIKSSEIEFAWGPLGGGPPRDIAAIELVIAAGPGGQGSGVVRGSAPGGHQLLPDPASQASSALPGCEPLHVLRSIRRPPAGAARRPSEPQQLLIDFQREREYGGLTICWDPQRLPRAFDIRLSCDGSDWTTCFSTAAGGRPRDPCLPPRSRLALCSYRARRRACSGEGFGIVRVEVQPHAFSRSINDFFSAIAQRAQQRAISQISLGRQTYWTPVGTGEDVTQALFNEEGMVEVDRGSFSIEPLLFADGRLITWADVALTQTLEQGYLPIPSCAMAGRRPDA